MALKGATPEEFLKLEGPLTRARPDNAWLALAFAGARAETGAWDVVLERTTAAMAKLKPERFNAWVPLLEFRTLALEKTGHPGQTLREIEALRTIPDSLFHNTATGLSYAASARLLKRLVR
jgi:hypothetical protein